MGRERMRENPVDDFNHEATRRDAGQPERLH
jgi:hypothetical protein